MKAGREGRWLVGEELEKGIALQQHAAGMHRAHSAALLLLVLRVCCACSAACELTGCSISLLPSPSLTVPYGLAEFPLQELEIASNKTLFLYKHPTNGVLGTRCSPTGTL